jgi:hypothetical protein
VNGRRAKRRRYDEMEYQLPGYVIGHADRFGNVLADVEAGIVSNIDYLVANVVDPVPEGGAETVSSSLTIAGQPNRSAGVQADIVFGSLQGLQNRKAAKVPFVLRLTVPEGRYVASGSAFATWSTWTGAAAGTVTPP